VNHNLYLPNLLALETGLIAPVELLRDTASGVAAGVLRAEWKLPAGGLAPPLLRSPGVADAPGVEAPEPPASMFWRARPSSTCVWGVQGWRLGPCNFEQMKMSAGVLERLCAGMGTGLKRELCSDDGMHPAVTGRCEGEQTLQGP
jgi:hypothetical protein